MEPLLEQLSNPHYWDWQIRSYDGWKLVVIGGTDLSYHHQVEAIFHGIVYLQCPNYFSNASFRIGTESERKAMQRLVAIEEDEWVFAIDAETSVSIDALPFFIVAGDLTVSAGLVPHAIAGSGQ